MNIKTLVLTATFAMSAITPCYANDSVEWCNANGDLYLTVADARDSGVPIEKTIALVKKGFETTKRMIQPTIIVVKTIYAHPEVSKEEIYGKFMSACIKRLVGTDM